MKPRLPSCEKLGDLSPFISNFIVAFDELSLLAFYPLAVLNRVIKVVVITLSALLAVPTPNVKLTLHNFGNLRPFLNPPFFIDFFQNIVFLC
jgi:hypothetical protein